MAWQVQIKDAAKNVRASFEAGLVGQDVDLETARAVLTMLDLSIAAVPPETILRVRGAGGSPVPGDLFFQSQPL